MHSCPKCWASPATPLFCEQCEELLEPESRHSPFEVLGVEAAYPVDAMSLRKRLLSLSRRMHPDFHAGAEAHVRELAERNTAELNTAFEVLADDFRRADWLVKSLGGPGEDEERQMPREFLIEVLEWNEAVEEARAAEPGSPERATLAELEETLTEQRARTMEDVSALLTPLPEAASPQLVEVRKRLNAVRYLNRTLHEIAELRLAEASSL